MKRGNGSSMRMKLLLLIAVSSALVTGMQAQTQSGDEQQAGSESEQGLPHIQVSSLSDRHGVDFGPYLAAWRKTTEESWKKLFPHGAMTPIVQREVVTIRLKILPNGYIVNGSLFLEGQSGNTLLDRAAWGALVNSKYPPLPSAFHGPCVELRTVFSFDASPEWTQ